MTMTDYVYKAILSEVNQCSLMGIEYILKSETFNGMRVIVTKDTFGQYRALLKHIESKRIVSAILFDQFKTVHFKYTLPDHRGNNYTKQLFAYTELVVKRKFRHSDNLTEAGEKSI